MKKIIKEYWLMVLIASVIIAVDQITKAVVRENIPFGGSWMPWRWLAPYFRFVHWENTGAAFGFFQDGGFIFGVLAVVVAGFIVFYYPQIPKGETLMRVALSMQLGGAIGNLIDRVRVGDGLFGGPVTDFISVGRFPVFNVADSCITVGVGLLILAMWIDEWKHKKAAQENDNKQMDPVAESVDD